MQGPLDSRPLVSGPNAWSRAAPERQRPTLWLEHLKFVTGGNRDLQAYLHRVCGYCLTGDVSEEVFFFLYGTGKNGKSVFVETIRDILGDYAQVTSMDTFTATHNPTHPTDLAKLRIPLQRGALSINAFGPRMNAILRWPKE